MLTKLYQRDERYWMVNIGQRSQRWLRDINVLFCNLTGEIRPMRWHRPNQQVVVVASRSLSIL